MYSYPSYESFLPSLPVNALYVIHLIWNHRFKNVKGHQRSLSPTPSFYRWGGGVKVGKVICPMSPSWDCNKGPPVPNSVLFLLHHSVCWKITDLSNCRLKYDKYMKSTVKWDEVYFLWESSLFPHLYLLAYVNCIRTTFHMYTYFGKIYIYMYVEKSP